MARYEKELETMTREHNKKYIKQLEDIIVCLVHCSGLNKTQERIVKKIT